MIGGLGTLLIFIIILGVIVLVHEFGHFFFAKKFGVYVHEFSIGMGPKLWGKKKGETDYSIRAIPIGGYCALAGEDGEETDDKGKKIPKNKKLFAKPIWQRFLILFFGAGNNFILAIILLFLIGLIFGAPNMDTTITNLTEGYPMEKAGVEVGDKIIKINGHKTRTMDDVQVRLLLVKEGSDLDITVRKEDKSIKTYTIKPKKDILDGETKYYYGITFVTSYKHGPINAVVYAFEKTGAMIRQMIIVLGSLFTGKLSVGSLSGPVGIYSTVGEAKEYGIATLIQLTALLSINIGFLNLIPFPAFDGGRIFLLLIEKIRGKPMKSETENMINTVGFILIIILALYVTGSDIFKLIKK